VAPAAFAAILAGIDAKRWHYTLAGLADLRKRTLRGGERHADLQGPR
jgi:hypothetical protein